jgi:hypothetical protein
MRKPAQIGAIAATLLVGTAGAQAGPWKDGMAAYNCGDHRLLVEDAARPIILHSSAGNCWQPHVKDFRPYDNSQYNNLRFEEVWLDK